MRSRATEIGPGYFCGYNVFENSGDDDSIDLFEMDTDDYDDILGQITLPVRAPVGSLPTLICNLHDLVLRINNGACGWPAEPYTLNEEITIHCQTLVDGNGQSTVVMTFEKNEIESFHLEAQYFLTFLLVADYYLKEAGFSV